MFGLPIQLLLQARMIDRKKLSNESLGTRINKYFWLGNNTSKMVKDGQMYWFYKQYEEQILL